MKYIMTGVNLSEIQKSDKGINTQVLKSALECHTIMSYFSKKEGGNSAPFTPEELDEEIKKQSALKKPLHVRLDDKKYVWSIIAV